MGGRDGRGRYMVGAPRRRDLCAVRGALAHAHYGSKGVLAAMAADALLTFYYLHHGSLLRVMVAHAVIDVLAFFIPAIADWIIMRKPPQWTFLAA